MIEIKRVYKDELQIISNYSEYYYDLEYEGFGGSGILFKNELKQIIEAIELFEQDSSIMKWDSEGNIERGK